MTGSITPAISRLRRAVLIASVVAVLAFPIVTYLAKPGPGGDFIVEPRFALAAELVIATVLAIVLGTIAARTASAPVARLTAAATTAIAPFTGVLPRAGLAALIAYPALVVLLVGWTGAIKWVDNFGVQILIYVLLGWGLSIVVGLAGLLDLGFIAFAAVGAYTYTLVSLNIIPVYAPALAPYAFWLCLPLSALLAALWGMILGAPVLGLRGDYLAIVTLAFGEMIRLVFVNWHDLTHGYSGLKAPHITFFGLPFTTTGRGPTFGSVFGLTQSPTILRAIFLYYVILALALLVAFVANRLRRLPVGRAWEALREDEIACRALGINTVTTKLSAFAIGAAFAGMAGTLFAARQGFINPKSFEFMQSATVLAIVVLGGMGSLTGVAIAAIVMIGGTELLRDITWLKALFGPEFDPAQYRMLLFGLGMVALMIWRPRGLVVSREPSILLSPRTAITASSFREGIG